MHRREIPVPLLRRVPAGGHRSLLLAGAAVALVSALLAMRLFLGFVRRHDMQAFGVYRIVLALALAAVLL